MTFVIIKGVSFEVLGPVDRRRSVELSRRGRLICPSCAEGGRREVGPFLHRDGTVNRYFFAHLKTDHFRCKCGWVGISPGAHVAFSKKHGGLSSRERVEPVTPRRVKITDLTPSR